MGGVPDAGATGVPHGGAGGQHDSRDRDPQWHVHQAILNRVLCADGEWRALDGKALRAAKVAAGAIAERVMEAHLARSVGARVELRADGKAREVVGIDVLNSDTTRRTSFRRSHVSLSSGVISQS